MSKSVLWGITEKFEKATLEEFEQPWKLSGLLRDLLIRKVTGNTVASINTRKTLDDLLVSDNEVILFHLATDGVFFWEDLKPLIANLKILLDWGTKYLVEGESLDLVSCLISNLETLSKQKGDTFKFFFLQDTTSDERVLECINARLPFEKKDRVRFILIRQEFAKVDRSTVTRVWNKSINYMRVCGSSVMSDLRDAFEGKDLTGSVTLFGISKDLVATSLKVYPNSFYLLDAIRDVVTLRASNFTSFNELCDTVLNTRLNSSLGACTNAVRKYIGLSYLYNNLCPSKLNKFALSLVSNGVFHSKDVAYLAKMLQLLDKGKKVQIPSDYFEQLEELLKDLRSLLEDYPAFILYDSSIGMPTMTHINEELRNSKEKLVKFCSVGDDYFLSEWNTEAFNK